jgi:hypothetical protein
MSLFCPPVSQGCGFMKLVETGSFGLPAVFPGSNAHIGCEHFVSLNTFEEVRVDIQVCGWDLRILAPPYETHHSNSGIHLPGMKIVLTLVQPTPSARVTYNAPLKHISAGENSSLDQFADLEHRSRNFVDMQPRSSDVQQDVCQSVCFANSRQDMLPY